MKFSFHTSAISRLWIVAQIALLASIQADELQLRFHLPPGSVSFLGTDNAQRGVALNPVTGNILVVSRSFGNEIHVLSGETGDALHTLNNEGLSGGTYVVNMIGAAEDGAVYVGNLSTSAVNPNFKLYRWADDNPNTLPETVYEGDPGASDLDADNAQRWGDSMDVRGSGASTQILLASRAGTQAAILAAADGSTFESSVIEVSGINGGDIGLGIAFGPGNTFYGTAVGRTLRRIEYDLASGTGQAIQEFDGANFPIGIAPLGSDVDSNLLATYNLSTHAATLLDITDPDNAPIFLAADALGSENDNVNGTGAVDLKDDVLVALETNNGLSVWDIQRSATAEPPSILTQPASQTVLETANVELSVAVTGTPPFEYQWYFNGDELPGETGAELRLDEATSNQSGVYTVVITNSAGTVTSDEATLTVNPLTATNKIQELWSLEAGSRPYLTTDNTQRGMAYNPASGHVLVASRAGGDGVFVLDGETGEDLHEMNVDPDFLVTGLFRLNMIAAADDGAVFVGNLTLNGADLNTPYSLYRWPSDASDAEVGLAFEGDPGFGATERWGDTLDARGSGTDTQVIASARSGNRVALFTTADGINFNLTPLDGTQGGLGLAFGEGDTFWTKSPGGSLFHYAFDSTAGTVALLREYSVPGEIPGSVAPIGVDPANGLLAGVHISTPDALLIYEISPDNADLTILSEQLFPSDNANGNNVGSVDFGMNRLYAMDTNNGLLAFEIDLSAEPEQPAILDAPELIGEGEVRIPFQGAANSAYTLQASSDLLTWSSLPSVQTDDQGRGLAETGESAQAHPFRFYRIQSGGNQ